MTHPRFTWKTTDGVNHEFMMTTAEISIGRAPTCDIVLADDQMVSRRHATIKQNKDNTLSVTDLGSSNGTLINGVEIHDVATLNDGDRVTIGDHDLLYAAAVEDSVPAPALAWGSETIGQFAPDTLEEQDTGALLASQAQSSYVHIVNGREVEREEASSSTYQPYNPQPEMPMWAPQVPQAPEPPPVPQRQDAASLLSTIQTLHSQLNEQLMDSNQAADQVRSGIRTALGQLDNALSSAQSSTRQAEMSDLRSLADSVGQSQRFDQAAAFASRAHEIRDVISAHQALLDALFVVRGQLEQTLRS